MLDRLKKERNTSEKKGDKRKIKGKKERRKIVKAKEKDIKERI